MTLQKLWYIKIHSLSGWGEFKQSPSTKYSVSTFFSKRITKCLKQLTPSNFQENMSVPSIWKYSLVFLKRICSQHISIINPYATSQDVKNLPKNGEMFKFLVYRFVLTTFRMFLWIQNCSGERIHLKDQTLTLTGTSQQYCCTDYPLD